MQLICPNCASSYAIADSALGERGRQVRCVKCKHVWFAAPAHAMAMAEPEVPAAAIEPPAVSNATAEPVQDHEAIAPDGTDVAPPSPLHIEHAPSIAPDQEASAAPPRPAGGGKLDYFELRRLRALRAITRRERGLGLTIGHLSAVMLGILVALIYTRENIVRIMPQTASLYALAGFHINLRGLAFEDVKTAYEVQDGVRVLTVEGQIRNIAGANRPVGRLRLALRNAAGAEIYTWTALPERASMSAGEVQSFKTRLASPPAEGKDLRVRFFQRRDLASAEAPSNGSASTPAQH
jgi:predicted Zn finger-like uncharacterized protein